jgi:hypothetical protein
MTLHLFGLCHGGEGKHIYVDNMIALTDGSGVVAVELRTRSRLQTERQVRKSREEWHRCQAIV